LPKSNLKAEIIVAGALGECVHIAGPLNFLHLAEEAGWRTVFLGPSVSINEFVTAMHNEKANQVGVSYRLTPETGERLLGAFSKTSDGLRADGVRFAFGGTLLVAERAEALGFFERVFDSTQPVEAVLAYLKGQVNDVGVESDYPQTLVERISWKAPFPILRSN